jgi:hypothetical protein
MLAYLVMHYLPLYYFHENKKRIRKFCIPIVLRLVLFCFTIKNEIYTCFKGKKTDTCFSKKLPSFLGPLARGAGRSSVLRNSAALNLKKV